MTNGESSSERNTRFHTISPKKEEAFHTIEKEAEQMSRHMDVSIFKRIDREYALGVIQLSFQDEFSLDNSLDMRAKAIFLYMVQSSSHFNIVQKGEAGIEISFVYKLY